MTTPCRFLLAALVCVVVASRPAFAAPQQHVVDRNQLTAAMTAQTASQDADRAAIHDALVRPEVKAVATRLGVDLTRLAAGVDTLSGADLDRAASAARQVTDQLVGGASTVVISTTTIIVILLVVLLIVVIAK